MSVRNDPLQGITWWFLLAALVIFGPMFYYAREEAKNIGGELRRSQVSIQLIINGTSYIDINIGGRK